MWQKGDKMNKQEKQRFVNSIVKMIDGYKEISNSYFGKISVQTIVFIEMMQRCLPEKTPDSMTSDKIIRKYLLWQSRKTPSKNIFYKYSGLEFSHNDDLTWIICEKIINEYSKTIAPNIISEYIEPKSLEPDDVLG